MASIKYIAAGAEVQLRRKSDGVWESYTLEHPMNVSILCGAFAARWHGKYNGCHETGPWAKANKIAHYYVLNNKDYDLACARSVSYAY